MSLGEVARLVIPSDFGYGHEGVAGVIGRDEDLIFDIELLSINGIASPERRRPRSSGVAPRSAASEGLQPCYHAVTGELVGHRDSNGLFHSVHDGAAQNQQRQQESEEPRRTRGGPVAWYPCAYGSAPRNLQQVGLPFPRFTAAFSPATSAFAQSVTPQTAALAPYLQNSGPYAPQLQAQPASGSVVSRPWIAGMGSFVPPAQLLPENLSVLPPASLASRGSFVAAGPSPSGGPFLPLQQTVTPFPSPPVPASAAVQFGPPFFYPALGGLPPRLGTQS
mmetsp:Transcript_54074/g.143970  ORF Transcript_54074/g.143970 Transcript_54074/m.143970 type:complete len:278 (+) Transcript_54074:220-1053(+)